MLILSALMRGDGGVCVHAKQTMLRNFKHTQTLPQLRSENGNNMSFPWEKEKNLEVRVPRLPWKGSIYKKKQTAQPLVTTSTLGKKPKQLNQPRTQRRLFAKLNCHFNVF